MSPVKWLAAGLFTAAVGIFIEYAVGVPGFPKVPPGPIILGIGAVLVLLVTPRWRWMPAIGLVMAFFIATGGIIEGSSWGRIGKPADFGPFIGTVLQWLGLAIAVVAGVISLGVLLRHRETAAG
jgi:hypothetical protein